MRWRITDRRRVCNRIPDDVRERIVQLALDEPDRSPREVAVMFTDGERSFVSEASVPSSSVLRDRLAKQSDDQITEYRFTPDLPTG